jgi:hypothetical protein
MSPPVIRPVDFDDPACTADFLDLLDHYMRGPSGSGRPLSTACACLQSCADAPPS